MHTIIHKLIHNRDGGVNIVAEVNAAIASGDSGASISSVRSDSRIVQVNRRPRANRQAEQKNQEKEVNHGETDA